MPNSESQEQGKVVIDSALPFSKQVDRVLSGADTASSHLEVLRITPPLLRMVGVPNLPILMTAKHIKSITQESGSDAANYHGLGVELVKQLPELISDPIMIMDSLTRDDSIVIVTQTVDSENRPIIGAIKLGGKGYVNSIEIDANILTSAYGKDNFQSFIERNIKQGTILYVDKEKSQELSKIPGLQLPDNFATLDFDIIIRKTNAFVKSKGQKNLENTEKENSEMAVSDKTPTTEMSAKERVQQVRDTMVQTLLEYIEKNPTEWERGWSITAAGAPMNGKTKKAYRGMNALYLSFIGRNKGYDDPRWVTFNQAKELGASVKRGEKSVPVIFFEYYDRATKRAFDNDTVKDMTDEEKKAYLKENVYAVMKFSSVFNAAQCHNFPQRDIKSLKMSEEERAKQNAQIETIIANSAAPISYDGGTRAYYSPGTDSIHLPEIGVFHSMQDYYATALHEIAHSTGHFTRLNREMGEGFGTEGYAKEELRAELACVFMQIEHGIQLDGKHIENHSAYLNSWLSAAKKDKSVFFKAAADAQKIATYVADNYLQATAGAVIKDENVAREQPERYPTADYLRAEQLNRMPLTPEELKARDTARDAAHAAGLPFYEGNDEDFEAFEDAGGYVYDGNMSVEDYKKMWELRESAEAKEREEQIAREDFPKDFEDDFTEALLDTIEEGKFLASEPIVEEKKELTVEEARNAMLDAQVKDTYHYAVKIGTMTYTDPEDGYESERPAQEIYVIGDDGRISLCSTLPIDAFDAYVFADSLPYGRTVRSYEQVEYEELEEIASKMRAPIEAYKTALRAEKEQTEERRRSDAYYEQRAMDVLEEHYAAGDGAFVREIENPKYLNGTLYAKETRVGFEVVSISKDALNRNIAIINRPNDYIVAVNYDTNDGTWGQGYYDFEDLKSAQKFIADEYGIKAEEPRVINLNAEQSAKPERGQETLDNLKSYEKWSESQSPIFTEYLKIKHENPQYMVFSRIGDFYELLGADAEKAARMLDLTLTGRDIGTREKIPMAGVPFHSIDEYAAKLANAGEKVLVADGQSIRKIDSASKSMAPNKQRSSDGKASSQNGKDNRTLGEELASGSVWVKIPVPKSSVGNAYGNTTLIRMPQGEYAHYALFLPNRFIKENEGKTELLISSNFTYRINNDGRQVELTGKELKDIFEGKQIGKEYKRVSISRQYAKTLSNLEKNVPDEIKEIPTWCCYRTHWNNEKGKKEKFIISPIDGKWASSKEPSKWVTFDAALKYARENNCEGVSVLLDKKYGITCIDLDKCVVSAETGEMKERAAKLIKELNGTYMERSTSGNGVHIFLKDDILRDGKYRNSSVDAKKGDLEVFDDKRIISMTGDMFSETSALKRAGSAATVYLRQELGERKQTTSNMFSRPTGSANLGDRELIQWIQGSKQGDKFNDLYNGRGVSGDKSLDDAKLAHLLLYFNGGDEEQAFRIMRESGLNRPDKPDSYYRHTIGAINGGINGYARRPNMTAGAAPGRSGAHSTWNKPRGRD